MKKFRKFVSVFLAFALMLTMFSSVRLVAFANPGESTVEEIEVDLTKSTSLGGSPVNVTDFSRGVIRTAANPGWFPNDGKTVETITWPDAIISLKDSNGEYITVEAGYKYAISVKYSVTKVNQTPQIAIVYNDTDSTEGLNGAHTLAVSGKHSAAGAYNLNAVTEGVANRPLRLAFGGGGVFSIDQVKIQRVASGTDVNIVTYVDGNLRTTEFAFDTLKTPEYPEYMGDTIHAVFGGWFDDAAFTTASGSTPVDGSTYYAKWRSVTREIDLVNANKLNGYNPGQANAGNTSIVPTFEDDVLKVDVNKTVAGNFYAGGTGHNDTDQQLTLEYFDYDNEIQDGEYSGYLSMDSNKKYGITVKYTVTSVTEKVQLSVVKGQKYVSWDANTAIIFCKNITATGSGTMYGQFSSGELIDSTYGANNGNTRMRIAFEGTGNIVIESVTVQEVYADDITAGTVVAGIVNDGGIEYKNAWVQNLNGDWEMPAPKVYGDVVDARIDGWYTDSGFTTAFSAPVSSNKKTSYYPLWGYVKHNIDLKNSDKMNGEANSDYVTFTPSVSGGAHTVSVQRFDQNLFTAGSNTPNATAWLKTTSLTMEYFDFETGTDAVYRGYVVLNSAYKYLVSVKYSVTQATQDEKYYPQIAIITNASYVSENAASTVIAAKKHGALGRGYTLSGIVSDSGNKLRLGFGGNGTFEIESVEIVRIPAGSNEYFAVSLTDRGETTVDFLESGAVLPVYPRNSLNNFGGWYNNGNERVTTVSSDVELTSKWFNKYDVNMDEEIDVRDLVNLKKGFGLPNSDLLYDIDRNDIIGEQDFFLMIGYLLSLATIDTGMTIDNIDISRYSVVSGAQKSLLTTLAVDNVTTEIPVSNKANTSRKIYIGVNEIENEVLESGALINLTGVKGDVYSDINDYKVFFYDGDLYIEGGSDYAVAYATNVFINFMKENGNFPAEQELSGKYAGGSKLLDGYSYVWGDEFDGAQLNTNKWYLTTGNQQGTNYSKTNSYYLSSLASLSNADSSDDFGGPWIDPSGNPNMQDGTVQFIDSEGNNYYLQNGLLVMNTKRISDGYSATKISAKQSFTYGIMTARVKLATANGACSTLWSRTVDNGGASVNEMDFVENYGAEQIVPNLHTWENYTEKYNHYNEINYKNIVLPANGESLSDEFHDIALYWTNQRIAFYFDGVKYLEQDISSDPEKWEAFYKSTYMVMSVSVPSNYYADNFNGKKPGDIMGSLINSFSENMYVDYIRVFQK